MLFKHHRIRRCEFWILESSKESFTAASPPLLHLSPPTVTLQGHRSIGFHQLTPEFSYSCLMQLRPLSRSVAAGSQSRDIIMCADTTCWQMPHSPSSDAPANRHAFAPSPASVSDPVPDLTPTSLPSATGTLAWGPWWLRSACLQLSILGITPMAPTTQLCYDMRVNEKQ